MPTHGSENAESGRGAAHVRALGIPPRPGATTGAIPVEKPRCSDRMSCWAPAMPTSSPHRHPMTSAPHEEKQAQSPPQPCTHLEYYLVNGRSRGTSSLSGRSKPLTAVERRRARRTSSFVKTQVPPTWVLADLELAAWTSPRPLRRSTPDTDVRSARTSSRLGSPSRSVSSASRRRRSGGTASTTPTPSPRTNAVAAGRLRQPPR